MVFSCDPLYNSFGIMGIVIGLGKGDGAGLSLHGYHIHPEIHGQSRDS